MCPAALQPGTAPRCPPASSQRPSERAQPVGSGAPRCSPARGRSLSRGSQRGQERKRLWEARGSVPAERSPAGCGAFLLPPDRKRIPSLRLQAWGVRGALIQGPEGEMGKNQSTKAFPGCADAGLHPPPSPRAAQPLVVSRLVWSCCFWLSLAEEPQAEQVLALLIPQNVPLQPLWWAPTIC